MNMGLRASRPYKVKTLTNRWPELSQIYFSAISAANFSATSAVKSFLLGTGETPVPP